MYFRLFRFLCPTHDFRSQMARRAVFSVSSKQKAPSLLLQLTQKYEFYEFSPTYWMMNVFEQLFFEYKKEGKKVVL